MIMARQYLTQAQKATVTEMAAAGHTVSEIADAIGKWPSTVRSFISGNIFEVRELQGKMPDGTPKAGREAGGTREASVSDFEKNDEAAEDERDYKHFDITVEDEEMPETGETQEDGMIEPESVWIQRRINVLGTAIGVYAVKQVPIDVRLVAEFNRHLEEIRVYRILEGNNAGEEENGQTT